MSEKISALLDGELPDQEGVEQISLLNGNTEFQRAWETYGLIGDVLRGHIHAGCASRVASRIAAEPVVIAPVHRSSRRSTYDRTGQKWFVMSAAAVIAAIALVAWVALPMMADPNHHLMARTLSGTVAVSATSERQSAEVPEAAPGAAQEVGGYIMAHQQFSPANSMHGVAPYVRMVSEDVVGASR